MALQHGYVWEEYRQKGNNVTLSYVVSYPTKRKADRIMQFSAKEEDKAHEILKFCREQGEAMPTDELKELCEEKRKALDDSGRFNAPPARRRRTQAHVPTQGAQKLLEPEPAPPPITESASTPPVPTQMRLTSASFPSVIHVLSSRQELAGSFFWQSATSPHRPSFYQVLELES